MSKTDLSSLLAELPPIISRNKIHELLGGIISTGYLQNLDSAGRGPTRLRCGKRIGYLREDLVRWLEARCVIISSGPRE